MIFNLLRRLSKWVWYPLVMLTVWLVLVIFLASQLSDPDYQKFLWVTTGAFSLTVSAVGTYLLNKEW